MSHIAAVCTCVLDNVRVGLGVHVAHEQLRLREASHEARNLEGGAALCARAERQVRLEHMQWL